MCRRAAKRQMLSCLVKFFGIEDFFAKCCVWIVRHGASDAIFVKWSIFLNYDRHRQEFVVKNRLKAVTRFTNAANLMDEHLFVFERNLRRLDILKTKKNATFAAK